MRVWDVGGHSDALVTVLDDISSSPCNDTDQKHHQMYHFQTWIQWQQTVRKQRIARPQLWAEARTRMIRAMGGRDPAAAMMDRHLCDGHNAETEIAMCPPVTWSDQSRMFAARFSFNLSLIFTVSEWKEEGLLFLSRPPPHYSRSDISPRVLSKCKYGNYSRNVDSVSSLSATNTSPRCWDSSPLRSLWPSSESLRVSQLLCDTRPVNISQTLTTHTVMILRSG